MLQAMKIAIVHEWFVTYVGSERVVEKILKLYPEADIYSLLDFLPEADRGFLNSKQVHTSFIQNLPFAKSHYRQYLALMPLAIEQFNLSGYDLVISSSHAVAKGVITGPDQLHISYVHSPIRYAWDMQHQYLEDSKLDKGVMTWPARWLLHQMRIWDYRTANGVDHFVANSEFIARRIWKVYRRAAKVIYPPVNVSEFSMHEKKEEFYLAASRMVPYKKMDLIVEAFARMPDKHLIVIGDGPDMQKIKKKAKRNIEILSYQPTEILRDYMQKSKAFVFAAQEDFGIMPLEAQACGTPVIAYGRGGIQETIRGLGHTRPSGVLYDEQNPDAIIHAVELFENNHHLITPQACRLNAERFAPERFLSEFAQFVETAWENFCVKRGNQLG
jgi:glycosyltransferase involved in cell wall biosynthesis